MTRGEAIDVLKRNYPSSCFEDLCEAVEIAIQALSAQPEQTDNAEFWRKRAEEYGKICFDLYTSMLEGTKFDSVKITEDGIVLMQKGGKNEIHN